jgi:hypothetical protein
MAENKSPEEEQAEKEAAAYFAEHHNDSDKPDDEQGTTIYSQAANTNSVETEAEKKKREDKADKAAMYGAGVGAFVAHKNIIPRAFNKVLKGYPTASGSSKTATTTGNAPRMRVEPNMGEPLIPHDVAGTHPSTVAEIMTSARGADEPTGRQKRQGHNMTAQREKWELEQKLKQQPSAKTEIIKFGAEYPRESGIIIPEHVGTQMEEEARRAHAERQALDAQATRDTSLRAERAANNAADAQAAAARRAEMISKGVKFGKGALNVGAGALGGYFTGKDILDIAPTVRKKGINLDEYTKEEKDKLLNTAGGLAMMIPYLPSQLVGAAMIGKGHQDELSSALDRLAPKRKTK